jgi:hypothetical protein
MTRGGVSSFLPRIERSSPLHSADVFGTFVAMSNHAGLPLAAARNARAIPTILRAGLVAGTLDVSAALLVYAQFGPTTGVRLLQGIAYGLIGKAALEGGYKTAFLGLCLHFVIATSWAAIYFAASRRVAFMLEQPVVSGGLYGVVVYFVMNHVVVPLSAIGPRPIVFSKAVIAAAILVVCIGLPIATIVSRFFVPGSPERR